MRKTDDEWSTHLGWFNPARGPVRNPGMGLVGYVYSDHMHVGANTEHILPQRPLDRESVRKMAALPLIDCLYIRCEWWELQARAGEIHLPQAWEWLLEEAEANGKPWGFRVMNHSPHSVRENGLPDFLRNRFEMRPYYNLYDTMPPGQRYYPRYTDEYLKWWNETIHLLGDRFDRDPLLAFGDVSGYGHWGEFHHDDQHLPKPETEERLEVIVDSLIRGHMDAFPTTPPALNLAFANFDCGLRAMDEGQCWLRKDSFGVGTLQTRLIQTMRRGNAMIWETLPVADDADNHPEMELAQRYLDLGCSYAGIGFNPWDALHIHEHHPLLLGKLQDRLDYRLRPSMAWRRQFLRGAPEVAVGIVNDGAASPSGALSVHAQFSGGPRLTAPVPAGQPVPGDMSIVAFPIPPEASACETVTFSLEIRMRGKTQPVRWAVDTPDGEPPRAITVAIQKPYDQRGSP